MKRTKIRVLIIVACVGIVNLLCAVLLAERVVNNAYTATRSNCSPPSLPFSLYEPRIFCLAVSIAHDEFC